MRVRDVQVEQLAAQIVDLKAQLALANAEQRKVLRLRLKACRVLLRWTQAGDKIGGHVQAAQKKPRRLTAGA